MKKVGAFHDYGFVSNIKNESPLLGYKDQTVAIRYNKLIQVEKWLEVLEPPSSINLVPINELHSIPNAGADSCCCILGYISKFELRETKGFNGKLQKGFVGELIDSTGSCNFVRWDHRDALGSPAPTIDLYLGSVVMIRGRKKIYSGKPQITLPTLQEMIKWKKWGTYINMERSIYYAPKPLRLETR